MKARRLLQEHIVLEVVENLQEIVWVKIASGVMSFIKTFVENLLKEELSAQIRAGRYERTKGRWGYRNGHYMRDLLTRFGPIEKMWGPQINQGDVEFSFLTATRVVVEM